MQECVKFSNVQNSIEDMAGDVNISLIRGRISDLQDSRGRENARAYLSQQAIRRLTTQKS